MRVVVSDTERQVLRKFSFDREIPLFGVGILEIALYRNRERQHGERETDAAVGRKIILAREQGVSKRGIETLLVRLIAHHSGLSRRSCAAGDGSRERALKNRRGVQSAEIGRIIQSGERRRTRACLNEGGLSAIERVRQERECRWRMVVEESETGTNHRLTIPPRVPRQANARRDIVGVERQALLHAERLFGRCIQSRGRRKKRIPVHVVAHAVIQR